LAALALVFRSFIGLTSCLRVVSCTPHARIVCRTGQGLSPNVRYTNRLYYTPLVKLDIHRTGRHDHQTVRDDERIFYQRLGELIRLRRLRRGVTQEALAEHWGLNRTTVVNLEKGRQRVSVHQLVFLADFLGCTTQELIPETNDTLPLSDHLREKAPDDKARTFISEISAARKQPK
jgi:transcriptional regulator with XRE-family HTH domain